MFPLIQDLRSLRAILFSVNWSEVNAVSINSGFEKPQSLHGSTPRRVQLIGAGFPLIQDLRSLRAGLGLGWLGLVSQFPLIQDLRSLRALAFLKLRSRKRKVSINSGFEKPQR